MTLLPVLIFKLVEEWKQLRLRPRFGSVPPRSALPSSPVLAAGKREAILRVRRSPRAAFSSATADPAKFESQTVRPCKAREAGEPRSAPESEPEGSSGDSRGARRLSRCPLSCRSRPHRRGHPAAQARGPVPGPQAPRGRESDPHTPEAAATRAEPTDAHLAGAMPDNRLCPPLATGFNSKALSPS
jgi:hypothetical protein